jgi:DNA-binding LytR/AlgR family response regulator
MTQLKCLILDDEPLAIDLIQTFLDRLGIKNTHRCEDPVEAYNRLSKEEFDVLFLDIEMPLLNGIELLRRLPRRPAVVITTAYRDYAVEGFELEVADYLVKPFSFPRFLQTMEKISRPSTPAPPADPHIFLRTDRQMIRIPIADILFIESKKDYVQVHTPSTQYLVHQTLSAITAQLPPDRFFRCHRSFTIALDRIERFRENTALIQGHDIPIARDTRMELRRLLSRR